MSPKCPTDGAPSARVRSATKTLSTHRLIATLSAMGHNPVTTDERTVRIELIHTVMTAFRGCEEVRE